MRLSILIAHNPIQKWRIQTFNSLLDNLHNQIKFDQQDYTMFGGRAWSNDVPVDVIWDSRSKISIGEKRNGLLKLAVKYQADDGHLAFVDDDDELSRNYVALLLEGIAKGVDCCSLTGIINEKGKESKFIHSMRYDSWFTGEDGVYYRSVNHLNGVKTSIASQIKFPHQDHGEDRVWSDNLRDSGLLKTEHWIEQPIYFYNPSSNRT